jgi:hypothetical protein
MIIDCYLRATTQSYTRSMMPFGVYDPVYQSSQVGALTGQLKASLNSRELAVVP